MSASWNNHGLYKDNTMWSGDETIYARFHSHGYKSNSDTHYRVFFKTKDGIIKSEREYLIDNINTYIKQTINADIDIISYLLCKWVNNEYRVCRQSDNWDIDIKNLKY